jgi:hypothetical protein
VLVSRRAGLARATPPIAVPNPGVTAVRTHAPPEPTTLQPIHLHRSFSLRSRFTSLLERLTVHIALGNRVLSGNWAAQEFWGFRNGGVHWRRSDQRLSCPAVRPPKRAAPFQIWSF